MTDDWLDVRIGDCRTVLDELPEQSVHCVVTSPPYWGLRDYGHGDQLGLEPTPEEYVANMVDVFRKVRRVLRDDGTVWLNLGDSYQPNHVQRPRPNMGLNARNARTHENRMAPGLKPKDLVGIPWRVAFALQADGWYLRSDIIWSKPNPMPEPVTDRPTKAHEYVFLLSKSARYYFDQEAVAEQSTGRTDVGKMSFRADIGAGGVWRDQERTGDVTRRNIRTVWTIATQPYPGAHFATFPPALVEPCVKAGCPEGGVVLDPFGGSGTVGVVANKLSRRAILVELNPEYGEQIEQRNRQAVLGLA